MSRSSKRAHRPEQLSPAGYAFLDAGLRAVQHTPAHAHERRIERLAITYRPCQRGVDRLPEGRVQHDAFRLLALSHRYCDRGGIVTPTVVLGTYKSVADLPGSGRIRLVCDSAHTVGRLGGRFTPDPRVNLTASRAAVLMAESVADADERDLATSVTFPTYYFAFPARRLPVFEASIPQADWEAAEVRIGDFKAWPLEFFARPAEARYDVHPIDGSADPFANESSSVEEGAIRGGWILRDGLALPLAQKPEAIFADLSGLLGRSIRNPAWSTLRGRNIINKDHTYRQWLELISPYTGSGRNAPKPLDSGSAAGHFRARLGEAVDRGEGDDLIRDVTDACLAAGVPIPVDPEEAYDLVSSLADAPWARTWVEDTAAIQLVRLTGLPDPSTMTFSNGVVEADFHELGAYSDLFAQLPAGRVAEALRWKYGRNRSPISNIRLC